MGAVEVNRFGLTIPSVTLGTQPSATYGTAITPGQAPNYGNYTQLLAGATVTDEVWEIEIGVNSVGIAATARDCIVTIGWDLAGGTNYGVSLRTSIDHLLCSCASAYMGGAGGTGGGVPWTFNLRIPAGASIAAKAMVNSATLTAINVYVKLRCRPSRPWLLYRGEFVDTYGINTATASGTAVTPGTAAKGAYVSLGALTQTYQQFEFGVGCNDATMSNVGYEADIALGDVTTKDVIIEGAYVASNSETLTKRGGDRRNALAGTASTLFGRMQCSGTPDSNLSIAAYAVGG